MYSRKRKSGKKNTLYQKKTSYKRRTAAVNIAHIGGRSGTSVIHVSEQERISSYIDKQSVSHAFEIAIQPSVAPATGQVGYWNGEFKTLARIWLNPCNPGFRENLVNPPLTAASGWTIPNLGMSPWMSRVAANYAKYRLKSVTFKYKNTIGTATGGNVIMSVDFDPRDKNITDAQGMTQQLMFKEGAPWTEFSMSIPVDGATRYTANSSMSQVIDPNVSYDLTSVHGGCFYIGVEGYNVVAGAQPVVWGKLEVSYTFDLLEKRPDSEVPSGMNIVQPVGEIIGVAPIIVTTTPGVPYDNVEIGISSDPTFDEVIVRTLTAIGPNPGDGAVNASTFAGETMALAEGMTAADIVLTDGITTGNGGIIIGATGANFNDGILDMDASHDILLRHVVTASGPGKLLVCPSGSAVTIGALGGGDITFPGQVVAHNVGTDTLNCSGAVNLAQFSNPWPSYTPAVSGSVLSCTTANTLAWVPVATAELPETGYAVFTTSVGPQTVLSGGTLPFSVTNYTTGTVGATAIMAQEFTAGLNCIHIITRAGHDSKFIIQLNIGHLNAASAYGVLALELINPVSGVAQVYPGGQVNQRIVTPASAAGEIILTPAFHIELPSIAGLATGYFMCFKWASFTAGGVFTFGDANNVNPPAPLLIITETL